MSSPAANDRRFARETGPARVIADLAEPVLEELGFRLVRVKISGRDGGTVQIMAEKPTGEMTVEDCATIRQAVPGSRRLRSDARPISARGFLSRYRPAIGATERLCAVGGSRSQGRAERAGRRAQTFQ